MSTLGELLHFLWQFLQPVSPFLFLEGIAEQRRTSFSKQWRTAYKRPISRALFRVVTLNGANASESNPKHSATFFRGNECYREWLLKNSMFIAVLAWNQLGPSSFFLSLGKRNKTKVALVFALGWLYPLFILGWLAPLAIGIYRVALRQ